MTMYSDDRGHGRSPRQRPDSAPARGPDRGHDRGRDDGYDDGYANEQVGAPAGSRYYPARQEDPYAEDTERLYESFNDLYEDFDDSRSKAPFVIIGALLAVAIVGGGLAFAYKQGLDGSDGDGVPMIVADRGSDKVAPEKPGGMEIPHQDSVVFDSINGQTADPTADTPPSLAARDTSSGQPLTIGELASRVTTDGSGSNGGQPLALPGTPAGQSETLLSPGGQTAGLPKPLLPPGAEAPADGSGSLQPRKVETFTITPDGRIVEQPATAPQAPVGQTATTQPGAPLEVPALPSVMQRAGTPDAGTTSLAPLASDTDVRRTPSLSGGGTASLAPSPQPKPRPTTQDLAAVRDAQVASQRVAPRATPTPAPAPAAAALDGKFAVQVASNQRQADSLSIFADLQRRYPNLVQGYRPLIQRADLGSRGVFYRLRIGPIDSRSEANQLCGDLRNAGLPGCIVRGL